MTTTKIIPLVAAAWCVVLAVAEFTEDWVYDLSRWGICASAGFLAWKTQIRILRFILAVVAVMFNPIAPVRFEEDEWVVADWIAASLFTASSFIQSSQWGRIKGSVGSSWKTRRAIIVVSYKVFFMSIIAFMSALVIAGAVIGICCMISIAK